MSDHVRTLGKLHRQLSASDRAVEIQAAQAVEVVRRLILLGQTEGLRAMTKAGEDFIPSPGRDECGVPRSWNLEDELRRRAAR